MTLSRHGCLPSRHLPDFSFYPPQERMGELHAWSGPPDVRPRPYIVQVSACPAMHFLTADF